MVGSKYEPSPRPGPRVDFPPAHARRSSVMLLLFWDQDRWKIPLTVRQDTLPDHPGQICLPGGAVEAGETIDAAAIRECREELGFKEHIDLIGGLSPLYVGVSNFLIETRVGVLDRRPLWCPNVREVAEVLEIPLDHLFDEAHFGSRERFSHGRSFLAPFFAWKNHEIWGATCMILGEFITVVEGMSADAFAT